MQVGFIGLGQMGRHMAARILGAGFNLTVHDLRPEAATHLLEQGAQWANTPENLAQSCQIVFSSLPTPQDVEQVVFGTNGLRAGWKEGDIYVDLSTNSPATIRQIAESARTVGVAVLDAPVSGGPAGAELGTLSIMVGGDAGALEQARVVIQAFAQKIFHVGDVGCGNVVKLVNNMMLATYSAIAAEGFVLGMKAGIDPQTLWDIITVSSGNSVAVQRFAQTVLKGSFSPAFRLSLACKDMGLAIELGKQCDVPLPLGSAVQQKLIEAKAAGYGDDDVDSIILRLEELVGVQVRSRTLSSAGGLAGKERPRSSCGQQMLVD